MWRQDMSQAADPCAKVSRAEVWWALIGLVIHHLTLARDQGLVVSLNITNVAVLSEGARLLLNDPAWFEGVRVMGVEGHMWHTPRMGTGASPSSWR